MDNQQNSSMLYYLYHYKLNTWINNMRMDIQVDNILFMNIFKKNKI